MRKVWMMLGVAGVAVLGAASLAPEGGLEQDTLQAKVARLERDLKAQTTVIAMQDQMVKDLMKRTEALENWLQTLPDKILALDRGLVRSRNEGFVAAGANPNAREVLLRTLRDFGQGIIASIPKPTPKKGRR